MEYSLILKKSLSKQRSSTYLKKTRNLITTNEFLFLKIYNFSTTLFCLEAIIIRYSS